MSSKVEKFREPLALYPTGLGAKAQDVFALVLRELSKLSGHNRKEFNKSEKDPKYKPKYLPIPEMFSFPEEEIIRVFDCSVKDIVRTLEPAADSLMDQQVVMWKEEGKGFDKMRLVRRVKFMRGGTFDVLLEPEIAQTLYEEIGERFSEMDLKLFVALSGKYERRLLKLLSKWRGLVQGAPKMAFDDYRVEIGIDEDKHTRPDAFRKYCIIDPINDIIKKSDGMWVPTDAEGKGYMLYKTGRKFSHVKFCLDWRPNEVEIIVNEDLEREKILKDLEKTEQMILMIPELPALIIDTYLEKAREVKHKIPFEVQVKIKTGKNQDNGDDIPY